MPDMQEPISIAIIGAGIASLSLARGLLQEQQQQNQNKNKNQNKQISLHIFEARPTVGQHDGSGVGIGANGQIALQLLDPSGELSQSLHRAGSVENAPSARLILAQGSDAGEVVAEIQSQPAQRTVRRNRLLAEMAQLLPDGVVQTGRKVVSISEKETGEVELGFERGEVGVFDAVVGADGVNSVVRRHLYTDKEAEWAHGFNTRIVIPMAEAKQIFGEGYCSQNTQTGWIGDGGFCLTDMEDSGNAMQVIAGFFTPGHPTPEVYGKAWVEVSKEFWTSRLKGWGWIGEKICRVIEDQEKVFAACRRSQDETPVYCKGRTCLAGDAAGSFAPALGAGASQALEDSLILSTALGCVKRADDLEKAFRIYGDMRSPRRERVATESNKQLKKITGVMEGVGTNREKLAVAVQEPYEYLFEYDLEEAVRKAKEAMK